MSDEDDEFEDDDLDEVDEDDEPSEPLVTIEITGLSLFTHHGVSEAEREVGQRLVIDLRIEVGACDATVTDRVEDTVDYGEVCQTVALVAQQRSYKTLERLCAAIADRLLDDY
jgi:7,8-dihydroneopterin aldolase/epimerase/oxygenase